MNIDTGKDKLIRENWKEWFRFEVADFAYNLKGFRLPKGFIKTWEYEDKLVDVYWFILFVPFVKFWQQIKKWWWVIPKWLYKKDYFEHKEGELEHWFWFKKIRIKKLTNK